MEIKGINMTDEYSANYFLQQGYLAGRIELLALREQIAQQIQDIEIHPSIDNAVGMQIQATKIARGNNGN